MTKKEKTVMRLYGIDKDEFLVKVARAYMAYLEMQGKTYSVQIAFTRQKKRDERIRARVKLNSFDIVVTNPPHGKKLVEADLDTLEQYELALKWKEEDGVWKAEGRREYVASAILFLERCLQFLRLGGINSALGP